MSAPDLTRFLEALFGFEPEGAFIELRWKLRDASGMGREFYPVRRREQVAEIIEARGKDTDLYIKVTPCARREGGRSATLRGHVLYVDLDTPEAVAALGRFNPAPSIVINSGNGLHCYWCLVEPLHAAFLEQANRRLAHALGGDMKCTEPARLLRPPGTFNWKSTPPKPVAIVQLETTVFDAREVVGNLPDPPESRAPRRPESRRMAPPSARHGDPLLTIAPPIYTEALTGRQVGADGFMRCPVHKGGEERSPSLRVYESVEAGWNCFAGCGGGDIYSFAGLLWGLDWRAADDFKLIRQRLAAEMLASVAA